MRLVTVRPDGGAPGGVGDGGDGGVGIDGGDGGRDRLGVLEGERVVAVEDLLRDGPWTMGRLLDGGPAAVDRVRDALAASGSGMAGRALRDVRLAAPVARPGKIIAVGRNYREHAAEEGAAIAPDPILFTKYPSSIVGPGAPITWRAADSAQVDYEAELAVVIGRRVRDVAERDALDAALGYTCLNDVSARDLQVRDGQWVRAKSLDSFCPIGPWLVTRDELPDPGDLAIRCTVNGEVRQDSRTREMIHGVASLIAFCSRFFTLEPGDVIATGTPGGVGAFRDPPLFLRDGDVVAVSIEGIGTLENACRVLP